MCCRLVCFFHFFYLSVFFFSFAYDAVLSRKNCPPFGFKINYLPYCTKDRFILSIIKSNSNAGKQFLSFFSPDSFYHNKCTAVNHVELDVLFIQYIRMKQTINLETKTKTKKNSMLQYAVDLFSADVIFFVLPFSMRK